MIRILVIVFFGLILFPIEGESQDLWTEAVSAYENNKDSHTITLLDSLSEEIQNIDEPICGNYFISTISNIAILKSKALLRLGEFQSCRENLYTNFLGGGYQESKADSLIVASLFQQYGYSKGMKILRKRTLKSKLHYTKFQSFVFFKHRKEQFRFYDIDFLREEYHSKNKDLINFEAYWRNNFLKKIEDFLPN